MLKVSDIVDADETAVIVKENGAINEKLRCFHCNKRECVLKVRHGASKALGSRALKWGIIWSGIPAKRMSEKTEPPLYLVRIKQHGEMFSCTSISRPC